MVPPNPLQLSPYDDGPRPGAAAHTAARGPKSREEVLARLLRKRAAAHRAGLFDLDAALRRQIEWALPVRRIEIEASAGHGEAALDNRL